MSGAHPLPTTSQEERARFQEDDDLFRFQLRRLRAGSATASPSPDTPHLQTIGEAAADLVATMAERIRNGQLTPTMVALLAGYLDNLTTSPERFVLLEINKANRPTTKVGQETSAALAFTDALGRGLGETSALIEAYDAYFSAGPLPKDGAGRRTYANDLKTKPRSFNPRHSKEADGTMASTIRPALTRMKLLVKAGPGRKKKPK